MACLPTGCGGGTPSAGGLVDQLTTADGIGCYDRRDVKNDAGQIDTVGCFTRDSNRYLLTLTDNPGLTIAMSQDDGTTGPGWSATGGSLGGKIAHNARQAR